MILKSSVWVVAALACAAVSGQAQPASKPEIVSSLTLEGFQKIVQGMGLECTREKGENGKLNDYFFFRGDGYKVVARVPSPDYAYLFNIFTDKVPLEAVNQWNQENAFSRASTGKDGNLYLEAEIPVAGGVTKENIQQQIKTFRTSVEKWAQFLVEYEKKNPGSPSANSPAVPASTKAPPRSYTRSPNAKQRLKTPAGDFAIWVDDSKWKQQTTDEAGVLEFAHKNGTLWAKVISERIGIPNEGLREIALTNAKKVAPDAKVTLEELRIVNGHQVLAMQIVGTTKGIPFRFFGYYHGGTSGSVQAVSWTVDSAFAENLQEITSFLNGLEIGDQDLPSTESSTPGGVLQFNGKMSVTYDSKKWKQTPSEESGRYSFQHSSGDGYAMVIAERLSVPTDALPDVALTNARSADPNAKIVFREKRTVNGSEVWFLKIDAIVDKVPLMYYGYYFGGPNGTVQVITYTGKNLAPEYEKDFLEFLNGLRTGE